MVGGDNDNPLKLGLQEKLEVCETFEIDSFLAQFEIVSEGNEVSMSVLCSSLDFSSTTRHSITMDNDHGIY